MDREGQTDLCCGQTIGNGPLVLWTKTVSSRDGETAAVVGHDVLESVAMWELTWPSWNRLAVWESDCLGLRWSPAS